MDLHLAYQETPRLAALLRAWDAGVAAERPLVHHHWTDIVLWPAARSATVAGSTAIEGNRLSPSAVDAVLAGQTPEGRRADIRDVRNYNAALDLANRAALRPDFEWSQELIRRLNATVLDGLEDDESGEYRTQPVVVGQVFEPPEAVRIPGLMRDLETWLRADDGATHTLVFAGLVHLNVVSIHPWLNGNGRTARIASSLALMRRGIGAPELVNVESWIRAHPGAYAAVLQETHGPTYHPEEHSATPFLEYFAGISVDRLDLRNRMLAATRLDIGTLAIELSDRGESPDWLPVLLAAAIGPLRTTPLAQRMDLSPPRMRAMLAAMVAAGWLVAEGAQRGRSYVPGPRLVALDLRAPEFMRRLRSGTAADGGA